MPVYGSVSLHAHVSHVWRRQVSFGSWPLLVYIGIGLQWDALAVRSVRRLYNHTRCVPNTRLSWETLDMQGVYRLRHVIGFHTLQPPTGTRSLTFLMPRRVKSCHGRCAWRNGMLQDIYIYIFTIATGAKYVLNQWFTTRCVC